MSAQKNLPQVMVIGSHGQLGQSLKILAPDWQFIDRKALDLNDLASIPVFFKSHHPHTIINAAGYTKVDMAETEVEQAMTVNGYASGELAKHCQRYVYISTDYVFSGKSDKPYLEGDSVGPMGVYGRSKLLGEDLALQNNPASVVLRTSWLFSQYGQNFVKTMLRLAESKIQLKVVADQMGSPTYAVDLADVIVKIVTLGESFKPGIYHFSNSGQCSWFDLAQETFRLANKNIDLIPIPTTDYPTAATRPEYSVLDTNKLSSALKLKIHDWQHSLRKCLEILNEKTKERI